MEDENISLEVFDRREEQKNNFDRYPCTIYLSINQLRLVFFSLPVSLLRSDSVASQPIDDGKNPDRKRSLDGLLRTSLALWPLISEFSCAMRMDEWRHDGFSPPVRNLCRNIWKKPTQSNTFSLLNYTWHWKIFYPDSDFRKRASKSRTQEDFSSRLASFFTRKSVWLAIYESIDVLFMIGPCEWHTTGDDRVRRRTKNTSNMLRWSRPTREAKL